MSNLLDITAFQAMYNGTLQPEKRFPFKLVVIGGRGVGKTALIRQLVHGEYTESYNPTTEERLQTPFTLGTRTYTLEITDTGSKDTCRDETIRQADGFLLVYDLCNQSTLEAIPGLHNEICKVKAEAVVDGLSSTSPPSAPPAIVVVGNKVDRVDERKVSEEKGKEKAESLKCGYIEVTAKGDVEKVFLAVIRRIIQRGELSSSCNDMGRASEEEANGWVCGLDKLFRK